MITKFDKIPNKEIAKTILSSYSYEQVLKKLGLSNGPNHREKIKRFIAENSIDISHFDRHWKHKSTKKHFEYEADCPCCGKKFKSKTHSRGRKITCSVSCSNKFFFEKRMTDKTRAKISKSVLDYNIKHGKIGKTIRKKYPRQYKKNCEVCGSEFYKNSSKTRTCSKDCSISLRNTLEYKKKLSDAQKMRVANGTHQGWKTRNISSYPEKYFQFRLGELGLSYSFNFPITKKELGEIGASCYFLDFYFPDKKIDLEIDGKQHIYESGRLLSDKKRDEILKNNGITVFRIPWKNPINDENKKYIDNKIKEFLNLYYSI